MSGRIDREKPLRAYFCYDGPLQRCGCKDPVQHAGPLQRRVHSGHLYPHHQRYAERCSGEDRRLHGNGHGQAGTRTARPAGGEPVQGDTIRESGIREIPQRRIHTVSGGQIIKCYFVSSLIA